MPGRLHDLVVGRVPEPALRKLMRARHGEPLDLERPVTREPPRGVTPQILERFDAHALRQATVEAVVEVLDRSRTEYVVLPAPHDGVRQIAVAAEDRARVLSALEPVPGKGWAFDPPGPGRTNDRVVRIFRSVVAPGGQVLGGPELGVEVGFWGPAPVGSKRDDGDPHTAGTRLAPSRNGVAAYLSAETWARAGRTPGHRPESPALPDLTEFTEPVDLVYTWVDGSDPEWLARKAAHSDNAEGLNHSAAHAARYLNRDELRYSLRSVAMYAGWVRRIHLVTDGQVPAWLDVDHPKINVVDHRDIFIDPSVLPVFNSHAIESQLHHIPDLAEHYLYLNDDVFFGRLVEPELFFHGNGIATFFLSKNLPDLDPPSTRDLPAVSAAKNQRRLIEDAFGRTVRHRFQHGVHPQLRAVAQEMEQRWPEVFAAVAASRFRHPDDVTIVTGLHHNYAYATARALPSTVRYAYQDLGRPNAARRLDHILRTRPQVFCLNDIDTDQHAVADQLQLLAPFFGEYFPVAAPWERRGVL